MSNALKGPRQVMPAACSAAQPSGDLRASSVEKGLALYDRNAEPLVRVPVNRMPALRTGMSQLYLSLMQSASPGDAAVTLIYVQITPEMAGELQIGKMIDKEVMLALDKGRGISLLRHSNGGLLACCLMLQPEGRDKRLICELSSYEASRELLKVWFAGWHHVFHEMFAHAERFYQGVSYGEGEEELYVLLRNSIT